VVADLMMKINVYNELSVRQLLGK